MEVSRYEDNELFDKDVLSLDKTENLIKLGIINTNDAKTIHYSCHRPIGIGYLEFGKPDESDILFTSYPTCTLRELFDKVPKCILSKSSRLFYCLDISVEVFLGKLSVSYKYIYSNDEVKFPRILLKRGDNLMLLLYELLIDLNSNKEELIETDLTIEKTS